MSNGRILQHSGSQNYRRPSGAITKIPLCYEDKENLSGGVSAKAMSTPQMFGKIDNEGYRVSSRDVSVLIKNIEWNSDKSFSESKRRSVLKDLNVGQCAPLIVKKSRACVKERRTGIHKDDICLSQAWQWREVSDNSSESSEMSEKSTKDDDPEDEDVAREENEGWEDVKRRLAFSEFEAELDDQEMPEGMADLSNEMTETAFEEAEGSSSEQDCRSNCEKYEFNNFEFSCFLCNERWSQEGVRESAAYWNVIDSRLSESFWKIRGMNNDERCCRWMEENQAGHLVVNDADDSEVLQQKAESESDSDVEDDDEEKRREGSEQEDSDDEDEGVEGEDEDEGEEEDNGGGGKVGKEGEEGGDDDDEDDDDEEDDDDDEEEEDEEEDEDDEEEEIVPVTKKPEIVKPKPSVSQGYAKGLDESESLDESKRIFVGGMPYTVTDEDIHSYFADCGGISEIDRVTFPDTGRFNGIAFLTFNTVVAAKKAVMYNGADMGGRYLKIEAYQQKPEGQKTPKQAGGFVKPPPKTPGCLTVYIGNLSWDIDEDTVRSFFYGCKIQAVRFVEDKITGDFKGFGHVDFEDEASLEQAISLDQTRCLGRPMKIAYAVVKPNIPKQGYERDGGGYGKGNNSGGADQDNISSKRSKKSGCFVCGGEGHKSYDCPQSEKGTKRQKR